jgi:hypothetical protein
VSSAKLKCIYQLPQQKRNDLRHLKMALEYVPCFISEAVLEGEVRAVLDMIARIKRLSLSQEAANCYFDHNLEIAHSIPIESISKSRNPKLRRFLEREWPIMGGQISRKREKEWLKRTKSNKAG